MLLNFRGEGGTTVIARRLKQGLEQGRLGQEYKTGAKAEARGGKS